MMIGSKRSAPEVPPPESAAGSVSFERTKEVMDEPEETRDMATEEGGGMTRASSVAEVVVIVVEEGSELVEGVAAAAESLESLADPITLSSSASTIGVFTDDVSSTTSSPPSLPAPSKTKLGTAPSFPLSHSFDPIPFGVFSASFPSSGVVTKGTGRFFVARCGEEWVEEEGERAVASEEGGGVHSSFSGRSRMGGRRRRPSMTILWARTRTSHWALGV